MLSLSCERESEYRKVLSPVDFPIAILVSVDFPFTIFVLVDLTFAIFVLVLLAVFNSRSTGLRKGSVFEQWLFMIAVGLEIFILLIRFLADH